MHEEVLFTERQKFRQWWVWLFLLGINGFFLFGIYHQIIRKQPFGDKPMSDTGLLIATGLCLVLTLLFACIHLDTVITKKGIYIRFFPFHLRFYHYPWSQLTRCYIRQYSPIKEFGGWGIRIGLAGKSKAYNVSGHIGLQLVRTDNKKILIGTHKPDELAEALKKIGQLTPPD